MGLGLIGTWAWVSQPEQARLPERYIDDPAEIVEYVELGGVGILTSENFVGHRIRVVEGTLRNLSDRQLLSVELLLTFRSVEGVPIVQSTEAGIAAPLEPLAQRRYVFRFENLPAEWDYRVPDVSIVRVGF